ncbi:uncharacterized protein [Spinacia oleracea]|uniref:PH domain-containing protein n=1 Tax=Spinacia oleracea TaxID=3562 RepID=A0ABM3RDW0_SPIOL|nr:uncharacterized protein LOC110796177 [Spinacia oleracea]XP_056693809.1 uncharacterized protein LOC110796177 [Spinacia oleracea]XP_056693810.1 uncharacterized protein LOC110796177 [Spinacia oleracea]
MAMETKVQKDGESYLITIGDKLITTTWARTESAAKKWISQVQKMYKKNNKNKKQPMVVGLWADRSINYPNGRYTYWTTKSKFIHKNHPYEVIILCAGDQCLMWEIEVQLRKPYDLESGYLLIQQPKILKDFLSNDRTTVVGVELNTMVKKLQNGTDFAIHKQVEIRDLVEAKLGKIETQGEFAKKSNVWSLVKPVLGTEMEVVKPKQVPWFSEKSRDVFSEELVKYGSIEAFLVAEMGSKLLKDKS